MFGRHGRNGNRAERDGLPGVESGYVFEAGGDRSPCSSALEENWDAFVDIPGARRHVVVIGMIVRDDDAGKTR